MFPLDNVTTSLAHIAFPLGFDTGLIGWRFPGVVWMQDLNHGSDGAHWRLDLGAFEGSWNGPDGAVDNTNYLTAGNAGFRPQVEARLHVQDKDWLAYVVAHYSQVDLRGVNGTAAAPIQSSVKSVGYEVGGGWKPGPWVFKATAYTGSGLGEIFGDLSQFGDIKDTGGYAQAGYNFTPHWSLNAFYAASRPNTDDVIRWMGNGATGLLRSSQTAMNLDYAAGAYELGLERMYSKLDSTTNGVNRKTTQGSQFNVSVRSGGRARRHLRWRVPDESPVHFAASTRGQAATGRHRPTADIASFDQPSGKLPFAFVVVADLEWKQADFCTAAAQAIWKPPEWKHFPWQNLFSDCSSPWMAMSTIRN